MSDIPLRYMDLALSGHVLPDEISDFVAVWHDGDSEEDLHRFLGMSWEEYSLWVTDSSQIQLIIAARHKNQSLVQAVNDNILLRNQIAARASDFKDTKPLQRWIESQR